MERDSFLFENLDVYKKSLEFVKAAYQAVKKFPQEERFALSDQFRRASISVPLNIAESQGGSALQTKRYLNIAKGSIRECIAIISLSKMQKYITIEEENLLREQCAELSRMLSGLIKYNNK